MVKTPGDWYSADVIAKAGTRTRRTRFNRAPAVADDFKGLGLGSCLMLSIMLKLMKDLEFQAKPFPDDTDFKRVSQLL